MTAPLTPAEALALAVRLRMHIDMHDNSVSVYYRDTTEVLKPCHAYLGADPLAAVCATIARAAAEYEAEHEPVICTACNGSGEGMHDGTRCRSCGGSGVDRAVEDDTRDWDAERKDRIERDLMERA